MGKSQDGHNQQSTLKEGTGPKAHGEPNIPSPFQQAGKQPTRPERGQKQETPPEGPPEGRTPGETGPQGHPPLPSFPPSPHHQLQGQQDSDSGVPPLSSKKRGERMNPFPPLPPFMEVRNSLGWWKSAGASQQLLRLIQKGVEPNWPCPQLSCHPQKKTPEEEQQAQHILQEYQQVGAARPLSFSERNSTRHLVPWFVLEKQDPTTGKIKGRLISDCREINSHLHTQRFRLDHWQQIFPGLRKGSWGAKIDLKNAYFHLEVATPLKPFLRLQVGQEIWQLEAAPFGLSTLPQLWMSLMKLLERRWRLQGHQVHIYLDDILVVGHNEQAVQKALQDMLQDLQHAGLQINREKSSLQPTQQLRHLGFIIDFHKGTLEVPPEKLRMVRKELGKFLTHSQMTPRKAQAILGTVRSFLSALPILRAFSDHLALFANRHTCTGWDRALPIPGSLQQQVRDLRDLLLHWQGRDLAGRGPKKIRTLHSDSSQNAWAGIDTTDNRAVQEFWRDQAGLHINIKELVAAMEAVQSFARPQEHVFISVDNTVAFSYLKKQGGRKPHFNNLLRPFLLWCQEHHISLHPILVKSQDQVADSLSRWSYDRGDYTLDRQIFLSLLEKFPNKQPTVDMFASPGNCQLPLFVSRWPHHRAIGVDALKMDLSCLHTCYSNPPWHIIHEWLLRLRLHPHIFCLTVVPAWAGSVWWPLLAKLCVRNMPIIQIQPREGLFTNCLGQSMPATRWPLLCMMLSGSVYREHKWHLKPSIYI